MHLLALSLTDYRTAMLIIGLIALVVVLAWPGASMKRPKD
jgi:hypothetical protein